MNCDTTRRLLEAHLDHELDVAHDLDVAAHLRTCAACAGLREAAELRRTAIRERLPRYEAPAHLQAKIRAALTVGRARVRPHGGKAAVRRDRAWAFSWPWAGLAAALTCAVAAGFSWGEFRGRQQRLFDEAIAEHVNALAVDHLMDVASTDQHTVKPWFAGKIDFSPPVTDLASEGYPLIGGRLDHLGGRPAAALVYKRRQHAINLFVWSDFGRTIAPRTTTESGYQAESWSADGLNFLAISEVPQTDLARFCALYRSAASATR